jgi:hypothetical protein
MLLALRSKTFRNNRERMNNAGKAQGFAHFRRQRKMNAYRLKEGELDKATKWAQALVETLKT